MPIVIEKNEMGGKPIFVGSLADLADVPAPHRRPVGRAERLALADPDWLSEANRIDPEKCLLVYSTLNGDMLGFQPPNRAVWYAHESGELDRTGSLRSVVDRFFRKLIEGEPLERECFYYTGPKVPHVGRASQPVPDGLGSPSYTIFFHAEVIN